MAEHAWFKRWRQPMICLLLPDIRGTLVVITDGHIQAGAEVSALINANLDQGNVFAMGIGTHVSQQTIERIARAGRGEPVFCRYEREGKPPQARRLLTMIESPLLTPTFGLSSTV